MRSWFRSCNLLKICSLPKFLYLFQALQILFHYFKQVHSLFVKFFWAHSKLRFPRRYLTLPKQYGGLALPDVRNYLAVDLGRIIDWNRHFKIKLWAQLEQAQTDIPLKGAMWGFDSFPSMLATCSVCALRLSSQPLETLLCFPFWATQPSFLEWRGQNLGHSLSNGPRPSISFFRWRQMAIPSATDE